MTTKKNTVTSKTSKTSKAKPTIKDEVIKVKVTKHPREIFYEGRTTRDHMEAQLNYLNSSPVIPDMEKIKPFVQSLKVNDIVGIEHSRYRVTSVSEDSFVGVDSKDVEFVPQKDRLTMAIGCGFAEILYRDDKPYGIDLEKEVKIRITDHTKTK